MSPPRAPSRRLAAPMSPPRAPSRRLPRRSPVADGTESEATRQVLLRAAGYVAFGLLWLGFVGAVFMFG